MDLRYICLNDKQPTEKLSDGGHPWNEVAHCADVGLLIPEPFIVLDFDTQSDAEIMLNIVNELDIKCNVMKTTRGYHFWFKSLEPWKNFKKTRLAIDIYSDCRSWGKLSYVKVKSNGVMREWIKTIPLDQMDYVPKWLQPLANTKYKFKGMKSGDGRNQDLFEYILVMQSKGYTRSEIKEAVNVINRFVFEEALNQSEINVILREDAFVDEEDIEISESSAYFDEEGKFKHNLFATELVKELKIVTLNNMIYVYKDGYYQLANNLIEKRMIDLFPTIKRNQRTEVIDYLKIISHVDNDDINHNEYVINLNNTRYDLKRNMPIPFDENSIEFARIPVDYDPNAYNPDLDKMLKRVFKNNQEVINLFEEMVGYILLKNNKYRKGFLFYGSGSNGKSTILNLIKKFIGYDNCATIEMEKLSDRFKTAELEHKLLNIGDDINKRDILDTGTLKKLFTGESITVERKGQDPFSLKSYAKMIFSANEIPRIADKTHGMYSRLMLIPFDARFSSTDSDFDPFIEDKISTPESLSYLLNIALRGLNRLLRNNDFTYPKVVVDALEAYKTDNSVVLTWISEEAIEPSELLDKTTDHLFNEFRDWCVRSEFKHTSSLKSFHKEIEERFDFIRMRIRNADTGQQYRWKFTKKTT